MLFLGVANMFEKFLPYLDSSHLPFRQATHVTVTTICSIVASLVAGRDAALHAFAYQLLDANGVHPCLCPLFVCHALWVIACDRSLPESFSERFIYTLFVPHVFFGGESKSRTSLYPSHPLLFFSGPACGFQNQAQGLQVPVPWRIDPTEGKVLDTVIGIGTWMGPQRSRHGVAPSRGSHDPNKML